MAKPQLTVSERIQAFAEMSNDERLYLLGWLASELENDDAFDRALASARAWGRKRDGGGQ